MDSKEDKKERRQGYFARLKKKKQAKPNSEGTQANSRGTSTCKPPSAKEVNEVLKPIPSQENSKIEVEKENGTEEEKKKKKTQSKQIRRTELKRYYSTEENPKKINEKKEKKMVTQKPPGTTEYIADRTDTLNSIALKFNVTPNKLVEMNRLFTHTIVPGQVLFVPDTEPYPGAATSVPSSSTIVSASSSDAEYDKLPDADLARKAKPIERVLSSTSEEEEPVVVKFLKMNCRYITDGKGVVGGVMIVTPNNVMFDPHKSDPLVIENGVEEYGLICPMDEVVSIALYSDISHMKIKDALPSDIPKDLCPLYRPGEWEDLSSEKDINPFSKFKSLNKEKRLQNESSIEEHLKSSTESQPEAKSSTGLAIPDAKMDLKTPEPLQTVCTAIALSDICVESKIGELTERVTTSKPRTKEHSPLEEDYIDLEKTQPLNKDAVGERKITCALEHEDAGESKTELPNSASNEPTVSSVLQVEPDIVDPATLMLDLCKQSDLVSGEHISEATESKSDTDLPIEKEVSNAPCTNFAVLASERLPLFHDLSETNTSVDKDILAVDRNQRLTGQLENPAVGPSSDLNLSPGKKVETVLKDGSSADNPKHSAESSVSYSPVDSLPEVQQDSESEIKLWLLKRMQGPIEDMMPSKEEKSKTPPMFLCIKVGKPMRKSFSAPNTVMVQQYARKRKQPEYWFAVPRERVDHLYTFFVQWSPEVYGKDAKEQGFVVVEKDELNMIDNFFSEPTTKSWEIITVEEAKRRKSICSLGEEEIEEFLPDLKHHSALFEDSHIEKLAHHLPARVQGYTWRLLYSTLEHGTSLKTLYRKTSSIDSPVLLVIKDMDNKVFGAYATHPFKFSDHYYGTGETFLYTFSPELKVFKWTGENSYFINGDLTSIELGGGGGGFGLWLDADLYHGRSNPCHTFNNETLSQKEDFIVQDVEVWTFE